MIGSMFDRQRRRPRRCRRHRADGGRGSRPDSIPRSAPRPACACSSPSTSSMRTRIARLFERPACRRRGEHGMDTGPVIGDGADIVEHLVAATAPEVVVSLRADLDLLEQFRGRPRRGSPRARSWRPCSAPGATTVTARDRRRRQGPEEEAGLRSRPRHALRRDDERHRDAADPQRPRARGAGGAPGPARPAAGWPWRMRERRAPPSAPASIRATSRCASASGATDRMLRAAKKARVEPVAADVLAAAPLAPPTTSTPRSPR